MIVEEIEKSINSIKWDESSKNDIKLRKTVRNFLKLVGSFKDLEDNVILYAFVAGRMSFFDGIPYGMDYFNKLSESIELGKDYIKTK